MNKTIQIVGYIAAIGCVMILAGSSTSPLYWALPIGPILFLISGLMHELAK